MSQPIRVCVCSQQFVNDPSAGSPTERLCSFSISEKLPIPHGDSRGSQVTAFADTVLHGTLLSQGTDCLLSAPRFVRRHPFPYSL